MIFKSKGNIAQCYMHTSTASALKDTSHPSFRIIQQ